MSGKVRKVFEEPCDQIGVLGAFPCLVPYVSFYTPGTSSCLVYILCHFLNFDFSVVHMKPYMDK